MHAFPLPAPLTNTLFALIAFFFFSAPFPAQADSLPPFVMPKIASWPQSARPLPTAIEEKALPSVIAKAEAGDTRAQMQLVRYYSDTATPHGEGRNLELAKTWNEKAAEKGDPDALFMQALWFIQDEGYTENSLALLEKAARNGGWMAAYYLGNYYREEDKQIPKAIHWYRVAVQNGFQPAARDLAEIYYPIRARRVRIQPDIATAYAWRILAQKGWEDTPEKPDGPEHNWAESNQEQLVVMQFFMMPSEKKAAVDMLLAWPEKLPPEGNIAPFDKEGYPTRKRLSEEESRTLYDKAMSGDKAAIGEFISFYFAGSLPALSKDDFLPLLKKGAEAGVSNAIDVLGWDYIGGYHSEKDEEKGYAMLHAQAARNDPLACYILGLLAAENAGREKPGTKNAVFWFEKGAALGDTGSMMMLGNHYEQQRNDKKAAIWYEKAAKGGNEHALMALLGLAESARDIGTLTKWMGIIILRSADPMVRYRTREMMGQMAYGQSWDSYQKILQEAEKWHRANPPPKKTENHYRMRI